MPKDTLDQMLAKSGLHEGAGYEGYSQQVAGQVATLRRLLREHRPKRILEIGFNAGHSAEIFLSTVADAVLLSFDLGSHAAVRVGKTFIDEAYPGRHTLVVGDSAGSIPAFASLVERTIPAFDFLFIDGGHTLEIATADLANCARFASPGAVVAIDDTVFTPQLERPYTIGPTEAWRGEDRTVNGTSAPNSEFVSGW